MNQEKIGKIIKEIRKKEGLTQREFANKYGVTYQAVSKWENGKNIPDISLLKEISKDYNIDINDFLDGKIKTKENKKIYFFLFLIPIAIIIVLILVKNETFSFKTLSSKCMDFNIKGSIAYNSNKSSIYISNIDYCGKKDGKLYKEIEYILYEKGPKEIARTKYNKKPITLEKYLKNLDIKIDHYKQSCKKYTKDTLYLKIKAKDEKNKIKTFKIPLSLDDNC